MEMKRAARMTMCLSIIVMGCSTLYGSMAPYGTPTAMIPADTVEPTSQPTRTFTVSPTDTPSPTPDPSPSPTTLPYTMVELENTTEDLSSVVYRESQNAERLGQAPYIQCTADWCPSCRALKRHMKDERMIAAYRGTYIILVDVDIWLDRLPSVGLYVTGIPSIYELTHEGKPTGRFITGAAWGDNKPEKMAPVLDAFFHPSE
jgi:hypothetical protein